MRNRNVRSYSISLQPFTSEPVPYWNRVSVLNPSYQYHHGHTASVCGRTLAGVLPLQAPSCSDTILALHPGVARSVLVLEDLDMEYIVAA